MARAFFILSAIVCIVLSASVAVSDHAGSEGPSVERLISSVTGLDLLGIEPTNTTYPKAIGNLSAAPVPVGDGCDSTNGHSCAPHLMSSGQLLAISGIGQKDRRIVVMTAAPDERDKSGLYRPPIKQS